MPEVSYLLEIRRTSNLLGLELRKDITPLEVAIIRRTLVLTELLGEEGLDNFATYIEGGIQYLENGADS